MKQTMSLVMICQDDKILLGMKKRGFGAGRWNGFGGKVNDSETIEESAKRETKEEIGVELLDLEKIAILEFSWQSKVDICEVHLFKSTKFSGEPVESEEMRPEWFDQNKIPFSKMWSDDIYWFTTFLKGQKFTAKFLFDKPLSDKVVEYDIKKVNKL